MKYDCYIASGWFNPQQENDLENIKAVLSFLKILYFSPKDECIAAPNSDSKWKEKVFSGNINAIKKSKFIIANTRDKDMGTVFECGIAYAFNIPIIYYCEGLKGDFNLMLSQSGIAVATSTEELEKHVKEFKKDSSYKKKYQGTIE